MTVITVSSPVSTLPTLSTRPELLDEAFRSAVADLLDLPELHSSLHRVHHFDLTEYDHLVQVAHTAHRVSRFFRADARVCARAGLLHDLGAHWFNTVAPVALAARLDEPHTVRHAIRAHTLLPVLPRTREAWAVVAADFLTTARECRFVIGRAGRQATARVRVPAVRSRLSLPSRLPLSGRLPRPKALQPRLALRRLSPLAGLGAGPFVRVAGAAETTVN